jgi:hypothetical protein
MGSFGSIRFRLGIFMPRNRLASLFLGLALVLGSSAAYAQCSGQPASGFVCGNPAASTGLPSFGSVSLLFDRALGGTQGMMLNRGASTWSGTATPSLGLNSGTGGSLTLNGSTSGSAQISVQAAAGTATLFQLPNTNGTNTFVLTTDGSGHLSWSNPAAGGTVTSVGLALPASILTVSGSPVTLTGTLTGTLATQSANLVWAGPTTGSAATPTFRSLVGADLPNPAASTLGGIESFAAIGSQWIRQISTTGVPTASQPAFTDISGSITAAQCPNPSASTIGCVESLVATAHQWINTISTAGVPSSTQPNFTDLAGSATLAQLPIVSNNSVLGNNSGGTAIPSALSASNVLDMINNVQGDVLYRDAAGWLALAPGSNGQVLTSGGAAANPSWATVSGTGTVTSIATNNGITGGTITTTGTLGLATIASHTLLANITGGSAIPSSNTPSSILDIIGSTTGNILYRSSGSGWQVLAPGSNGQVLTMGASTPAWGSAGTVSSVATGQGLVGGTITTTGTLTTAAGVAANVLNSQTSNYPIATSDCGKTVQAGTGSTGLFTVTLPVVSGFDAKCVVTVVNGDTGRGKILSGFPTTMTSPSILWPGQSVTVSIVNGAWVATNPGRWAKSSITFFIDSGASASDSNDGLANGVSGAGSFKTIARCISVAEQYIDTQSGGNGGVTCSPTSGQTFQEFDQVFFGLVGGGTIIFSGNGGAFNWAPANSGFAIQFGDLGVVGFTSVNFTTSGSTTPVGFVEGHNFGIADFNSGVAFHADSPSVSGSFVSCDFDSHININNGINYSGTAVSIFDSCQGSSWNLNSAINTTTTTSLTHLFNIHTASKVVIQGNVTWGTTSLSTGAGLVSGNSVLNNFSGSLPGGTPSPTTGGQYCTSAC